MKKIYTLLFTSLFFTNLFAQEDNCKCFNKQEYKVFVEKEQHQYVTEGNDAQLTVLLNTPINEDIIITYKVNEVTADINNDIVIPTNKSFIIPKGKTQATIHIPTNNDGIKELNESFEIEIISGVTSITQKKLNNNKLIRTRTIVDSNSNNTITKFYLENGVIKTTSAIDFLEVRNLNGILIKNENLTKGKTYLIKATHQNTSIAKTIIF